MKEWEKVAAIPDRGHGKNRLKNGVPDSYQIELKPGEIIRRPDTVNGSQSTYNHSFAAQGRTDYHAVSRTVDGVRYLYVWRDAETVQ